MATPLPYAPRVARPDFSGDDFLAAATLLESSPETFTERLADKVRRQEGENRIAPVDVLPDDDRYWNHLLPPVAGVDDACRLYRKRTECRVAGRP